MTALTYTFTPMVIQRSYFKEIFFKDKPMFTQKYYVAIAKVIHDRRVKLKSTLESMPGPDQDTRLDEINELALQLAKMFAEDNPKFRQLIFIEACCKDLA